LAVQDDRVAAFRDLHSSGCFVMPNPWDVGTARALEQMGFQALATTSAGFAWTLGRADNQVAIDEALEHLRLVADAVAVPVNADFQGGFAVDPEQVGANVKLAVATGIAGLSIEDSTGDEADPLYELDLGVERIRAARGAIDESGTGVVLTGRSEGFVVGRPDIDETIRRLRAYAKLAPTASTLQGSAPSSRFRDRRRGITSTGELVDQRAFHHCSGRGEPGSSADQRWRHARAHGVARVPAGRTGDRGGRDVLPVRAIAGRGRPV
jgi:hypothetical protein